MAQVLHGSKVLLLLDFCALEKAASWLSREFVFKLQSI